MKKEEIDKLWELYREFCKACRQPNVAMYAPEFLAWIEDYRLISNPNETI